MQPVCHSQKAKCNCDKSHSTGAGRLAVALRRAVDQAALSSMSRPKPNASLMRGFVARLALAVDSDDDFFEGFVYRFLRIMQLGVAFELLVVLEFGALLGSDAVYVFLSDLGGGNRIVKAIVERVENFAAQAFSQVD